MTKELTEALWRIESVVRGFGDKADLERFATVKQALEDSEKVKRTLLYQTNELENTKDRVRKLQADVEHWRRIDDVAIELAKAEAEVERLNNGYVPQGIAMECIGRLESAGCGKPGSPNTLHAMVVEIIARATKAEAELEKTRPLLKTAKEALLILLNEKVENLRAIEQRSHNFVSLRCDDCGSLNIGMVSQSDEKSIPPRSSTGEQGPYKAEAPGSIPGGAITNEERKEMVDRIGAWMSAFATSANPEHEDQWSEHYKRDEELWKKIRVILLAPKVGVTKDFIYAWASELSGMSKEGLVRWLPEMFCAGGVEVRDSAGVEVKVK
jgi:hypothetical protein